LLGGRVDLIPTLIFPCGFKSLEIDGVGFVGLLSSFLSCESTSKRLNVNNNFLLCCVLANLVRKKRRRGFFYLVFFYCARDQFLDGVLSMVTSWLPTEWLVLTRVETLLRRAGCSLVRSLDLVLAKFVFLCLYCIVDCGIIIIAMKSRGVRWDKHTSCCKYSEYVGKRRRDYSFCYLYRLWE